MSSVLDRARAKVEAAKDQVDLTGGGGRQLRLAVGELNPFLGTSPQWTEEQDLLANAIMEAPYEVEVGAEAAFDLTSCRMVCTELQLYSQDNRQAATNPNYLGGPINSNGQPRRQYRVEMTVYTPGFANGSKTPLAPGGVVKLKDNDGEYVAHPYYAKWAGFRQRTASFYLESRFSDTVDEALTTDKFIDPLRLYLVEQCGWMTWTPRRRRNGAPIIVREKRSRDSVFHIEAPHSAKRDNPGIGGLLQQQTNGFELDVMTILTGSQPASARNQNPQTGQPYPEFEDPLYELEANQRRTAVLGTMGDEFANRLLTSLTGIEPPNVNASNPDQAGGPFPQRATVESIEWHLAATANQFIGGARTNYRMSFFDNTRTSEKAEA